MEKLRISHEKLSHLKNLSAENGIIGALAIDQRGSLKKMLASGARNLVAGTPNSGSKRIEVAYGVN